MEVIQKTTNETVKNCYVSFDGIEFKDDNQRRQYENAVKIATCQRLIAKGVKIAEYDLYNETAGSEGYYYLVLDVNLENRGLIETLYKLYNTNTAYGFPMIGEKYVFGLGYVGYDNLDFETFYPYGTAKDFYDNITAKMQEVLL